jgi:hypothetical protein
MVHAITRPAASAAAALSMLKARAARRGVETVACATALAVSLGEIGVVEVRWW